MKILIAGATGLIGKELVRQCHESNISVHYLTTSRDKIVDRDNYKGFHWNTSQSEIDAAAFQGVTTIINLAGASVSKRWTKSYKTQILESRLNSAQLIYDTLKKINHQVTHYVSASGISIYPSSKERMYVEEDTEISDSFLGKVSVAWEAAADQFSELGMQVSKVRTGVVLDTDEGAFPQIVKPIKMSLGAALGDGEQWQSWIHIKDIAGIYLWLLSKQISGVFNGVAPSPVSNNRMTKIIAKQLDKPLWLPKVPSFFLRLVLGEMAALVLESQLVSSKKIEETGYRFHFVNLEKAVEDLI